MSINQPAVDWFQAPHGEERVWIGIAFLWCMVMTIAMPYWYLFGKQNSIGESYRVTPAEFRQRVDRFVQTNQVGEEQGFPVVQAAPGGDAYLNASMWMWYPILKFKKGQTYRLHISSSDLQHGFSLQPLNMNFQIIPGYDHVLTLTPTSSGTFSVICNEFCGIGHHTMTGRIIVED